MPNNFPLSKDYIGHRTRASECRGERDPLPDAEVPEQARLLECNFQSAPPPMEIKGFQPLRDGVQLILEEAEP
jgi:hypothetical protein